MVNYYNKIWFYGEMSMGKKHGRGVEIDIGKSTVWKGNFVEGKKTGYFHIEGLKLKYYGMVVDGRYQG